MKRFVLVFAVLALTVGHASEAYRPATDQEISLIRTSLQTTLKDADSAKFADVRVSVSGVDLCGLINSKNSFGAYSGFTYFVGIIMNTDVLNKDAKPLVDVFGVDSERGGPAEETCKSNGCCS
jgi:hypothetical protein